MERELYLLKKLLLGNKKAARDVYGFMSERRDLSQGDPCGKPATPCSKAIQYTPSPEGMPSAQVLFRS